MFSAPSPRPTSADASQASSSGSHARAASLSSSTLSSTISSTAGGPTLSRVSSMRSPSERSALLSPLSSTHSDAASAAVAAVRCSACDSVMDASAGAWTCSCGFLNVASSIICMQDGARKDEQDLFCSEQCQQQSQAAQASQAGSPAGASWLDRFTATGPLSPSYAHSFQRRVWFSQENAPCVNCTQCGSTVKISQRAMAAIHAHMAEEKFRRSSKGSRDSSGSAAALMASPDAGVAVSSPAAPQVGTAASSSSSRAAQPSARKPRRRFNFAAAIAQSERKGHEQEEPAERQRNVSSHDDSEDEPASAADSSSKPSPPAAVSAPVATPPALDQAINVSCPPVSSESSKAFATSVREPALKGHDLSSSHTSEANNVTHPSHTAAFRLHHPQLHVQTKELEQLPLLLPSPLTPTTLSEAHAAAVAAVAAGAAEGEWRGELQCAECDHKFRFTDLQ